MHLHAKYETNRIYFDNAEFLENTFFGCHVDVTRQIGEHIPFRPSDKEHFVINSMWLTICFFVCGDLDL